MRRLLACGTQPYQHITLKWGCFQVGVSFDKHLPGSKTTVQSRNMKNRRAALMGKLNFPLNTPHHFLFASKTDGGKKRKAFGVPQDKCMNSWSGASQLTRSLSSLCQVRYKHELSEHKRKRSGGDNIHFVTFKTKRFLLHDCTGFSFISIPADLTTKPTGRSDFKHRTASIILSSG